MLGGRMTIPQDDSHNQPEGTAIELEGARFTHLLGAPLRPMCAGSWFGALFTSSVWFRGREEPADPKP